MIQTDTKTLLLIVSAKPFEVMHTGEKGIEIREDEKWIRSKLFDKQGCNRKYDFVKIQHGYGNDRPYFIARCKGFDLAYFGEFEWSNELIVEWEEELRYIIKLGDIVERKNIKQ